jgi:hypothetical protein
MPATAPVVSVTLPPPLLLDADEEDALGDKGSVADGPDGEDGVVVEDEVKTVFVPIAITALSGVVAL